MLQRLRELGRMRVDFAFETTLASRTLAPWLRALAGSGYGVHVLYLWVARPEIALERVRARERAGGHGVPEEVVRQRYVRGLANFLELYRPLADGWVVYDNSTVAGPRPVASGGPQPVEGAHDAATWRRVLETGRG